MKNHLKLLCGAVMMVSIGQVYAATTWVLNTSSSGVAGNDSSVTATATGWADTGSGSGSSRAIEEQTAPDNFVRYQSTDPNTDVTTVYGLGINNLDGCSTTGCSTTGDYGDIRNNQPEHAIDNQGRYEMVLVSFGDKLVNLTSVNFGWTGTTDYSKDSDYTVMAFQGDAGNQSIDGSTWSSLSSSGWSLIGHYADATTNENRSLTSGGNSSAGVYSSFWLIGAYNPLVGSGNGWSGSDYLKLASVTGTVCAPGVPQCSPPTTGNVPEPGSLALVGLGLLGVMRLRKARQA